MKHSLSFIHAFLIGLSLLSQAKPEKTAERQDMLRFSERAKNDTLHGQFFGFDSPRTLKFKSTEAEAPIIFSTNKLHRITLNAGRAALSLSPATSVTLTNGDVIPGQIIHADNQTVTLKTQHLGTLRLATQHVTAISPNLHGGKLLYHGPLNQDGWQIITTPEKPNPNAPEKETEKSDWKYIAGAWYAGEQNESYILRKNALVDRCKVSFELAWRGFLYCNVAIHADFIPPKANKDKTLTNNLASSIGKGYLLNLSANSATLYSNNVGEDGKMLFKRITQQHANMGLSRDKKANIELRIDRPNHTILLYVNGSFKCKWALDEPYIGTANHIAFRSQNRNNSQLRISDIVISEWNGIKDSAMSMQSKQHDLILLTNGVDRFSGKLQSIRNGKVFFRGTFDNDLIIPLNTVQEIRFATDKLRKPADNAPEQHTARFHLQPFGRISGQPSSGSLNITKIHSSFAGDVNLDMKYVHLIDFSHQNNLLDFWNDHF